MTLITDRKIMKRYTRLTSSKVLNSLTLSTLALAFVLLGSGCFGDTICIEGDGPIVSETRSTGTFSKVNLPDAFDVILVPDTTHFVIIEGQENLVDRMETSVSGDRLTVRFPGCYRRAEPLRAYIHSAMFNEVDLRGSGDLWSDGVLLTDNFNLELTGSGDVDLQIEASDMLSTRISGSGDVILSGLATAVDYDILGSGNIEAFGLLAVDADVEITGSGDVDVYASGELSVRISGSGDVRYKGNPTITEVVITGSGSLINAE